MSQIQEAQLSASVWECDRHCAALVEALDEWRALPSPDVRALESERSWRHLTDRILYRFTKLQDAVGERLLPATLGWLQEPYEDWPMRDRLARLQKLHYLDADNWIAWRSVRNRLAHEYPEMAEMRRPAVLSAVEAATAMISAFAVWRRLLPAALTSSAAA